LLNSWIATGRRHCPAEGRIESAAIEGSINREMPEKQVDQAEGILELPAKAVILKIMSNRTPLRGSEFF
jgi:hypothetical protein